ncbi:MAG: hypothetical protein AAFV07_02060 [Bacteroidota bacterium]
MSVILDIQTLSKTGADFDQWLSSVKLAGVQTDQTFIDSLLQHLSNTQLAGPLRAKVAFIATQLKIAESIPVLGQSLGESWTPFSISMPRHQLDPEFALLEFGEQALPEIQQFLLRTTNPQAFKTGTIMLYNLLGDKALVQQQLNEIIAQRPEPDQPLYSLALNGLKEWK